MQVGAKRIDVAAAAVTATGLRVSGEPRPYSCNPYGEPLLQL